MSDTNTPAPTANSKGPAVDTPEVDHNRAGTDDVPNSKTPDDIKRDLATNPELNTLEGLQKRALALSEEMKKTEEIGKSIDPDDKDAVAQHELETEAQLKEGIALANEIKTLAVASQKNANAPGGSGGLRLSAPLLEKAWEFILLILEKLFELFKTGLRKVGILKGLEEGGGGGGPKQAEKSGGGLRIGGSDSAPADPTSPNPNAQKTVTATELDSKFGAALDSGTERLDAIKEQNAKLAAQAELNSDDSGPGVKTPK